MCIQYIYIYIHIWNIFIHSWLRNQLLTCMTSASVRFARCASCSWLSWLQLSGMIKSLHGMPDAPIFLEDAPGASGIAE